GPVENCPSDIRNSVWSQCKRLALNGDAGGESSLGAERTGEWHFECWRDLERQWNRRRNRVFRSDLRRGFESLPAGDQHHDVTGGIPCARRHSLNESGKRDRSERARFHEK